MTREHPILFSGPMIRAILSGQKTMTRRVLKIQPPDSWRPIVGRYHPTVIDRHGDEQPGPESFGVSDENYGCKLPWQPGQTLWVRERFSGEWPDDKIPPSQWDRGSPIWYWADGNPDYGDWTKPKPSIHMPRWASRITLLVEAVRVERLQEITSSAAINEGCQPHANSATIDCDTVDPRDDFRRLWNTINGAGSWDANPWVSVTTFRRVEKAAP